ncbi:MAG TPA: ABC transporter substrate-binding protein, partial [Candidatus Limnocylindrales bacterium]
MSPSAIPSGSPDAAGSGSPDLFASSYEPERGPDGGLLVIGDWQEATQLNPYYVAQVTEANVAALAWHTLVTISHDFRYVPQLAAAPLPSVENGGVLAPGTGGDAMTVKWALRPGLRWSDGVPLACDDFRYAWEWVTDPANAGVVTAGFEDISGIDCPSDTSMVWHFRRVYEGYLTLMTAPLPRHVLASIRIADQVNGAGFRPGEVPDMPVSGPFRFESVTPQAELRLARNAYYANPRTGTPAALDGIVFKWYADPDAMIAGFRNGETDLVYGLAEGDLPKVQDLGSAVVPITSLTYEFLRPNWSPADDFDAVLKNGGCSRNVRIADRGPGCPMADPAIREAVAYAIDKSEINTRLLDGNGQVANSNVTPSAWFYADQPP